MTFALFDEWVKADEVANAVAKREVIKKLYGRLPAANRLVADQLLSFLRRVSSRSKLTLHNLSVVWAPNILFPRDAMKQVEHSAAIRSVVHTLLNEFPLISTEVYSASSSTTTATSPSPSSSSSSSLSAAAAMAAMPQSPPPQSPPRRDPLRILVTGSGATDRPLTPTTPKMSPAHAEALGLLIEEAVENLFDSGLGASVERNLFYASEAAYRRDVQAQHKRSEDMFGPLNATGLVALQAERAAKRDRAVEVGSRHALNATERLDALLGNRGKVADVAVRSMSKEEQTRVVELYGQLREGLTRYEKDFFAAMGRHPTPTDRRDQRLTRAYDLQFSLFTLFSEVGPGSSIHAIYRGHIGRAHYNEVKSMRQADHPTPTASPALNAAQGAGLGSSLDSLSGSGGSSLATFLPSPTLGLQQQQQQHNHNHHHHHHHQHQQQPTSGNPPAIIGQPDALRSALLALERDRAQAGRPEDISKMTEAEMRAEKHATKKELKAFDAAITAVTGAPPQRHQKEIMRPLYRRYKELKDLLDKTAGGSGGGGDSDSDPKTKTGGGGGSSKPRPQSGSSVPSATAATVTALRGGSQTARPSSSPAHTSSALLAGATTGSLSARTTPGPTQAPAAPVASYLGFNASTTTPSTASTTSSYAAQQQQRAVLATNATRPTSATSPVSGLLMQGKGVLPANSAANANGNMGFASTVPVASRPSSAGMGGFDDGLGGGKDTPVPASLAADPVYRELKKEKRTLQGKLQNYQQEFVARHGRKVKYRADRAPVEAEYERYKLVKQRLEEMEAQAM